MSWVRQEEGSGLVLTRTAKSLVKGNAVIKNSLLTPCAGSQFLPVNLETKEGILKSFNLLLSLYFMKKLTVSVTKTPSLGEIGTL